ncbi:hypothetical protein ACFL96_09840 [Thermoproteota archaeon]
MILIPIISADISTTNPHIKTLEDWPTDVDLTCIPCHGDPLLTNTDIISVNCTNECHRTDASEIASSKHSNLKCIYCHTVLHIGDKDQENCNSDCHNIKENSHDHEGNDNFVSIWVLDKPDASDQNIRFREEFRSYTDLELMTELEMPKIEKGKIYLAYLNTQGISTGSNATRYLTCLNCHFITDVPEEVGILQTVTLGIVKIGIPKINQEFRDHNLVTRHDNDFITEQNDLINQILPALISIIVIVAITFVMIFLSKKEKLKVRRRNPIL